MLVSDKLDSIYEFGRTHALYGIPRYPKRHFTDDSYYYYELGFREIAEIGWH